MRLDHLLSKRRSKGCFTVKLPRNSVPKGEVAKQLISCYEVTVFPVAMRLGDTPVPIPNTTVKTQTADGTMLETAWESRWLPEY